MGIPPYTANGAGPSIGSPQGPVVASGIGTLGTLTTSALISTMTIAAGLPAFPSTPILLNIKNSDSSAAEAYFQPFGGTVAAQGIPMAAGDLITIALAEPDEATIQSGGTSEITFWW
jgi:hypothetical protein